MLETLTYMCSLLCHCASASYTPVARKAFTCLFLNTSSWTVSWAAWKVMWCVCFTCLRLSTSQIVTLKPLPYTLSCVPIPYVPVAWKSYICLFLNTSSWIVRWVAWKVTWCVCDQSFACLLRLTAFPLPCTLSCSPGSYRPVAWKAYICLFLNKNSWTVSWVAWKVTWCVCNQSFASLLRLTAFPLPCTLSCSSDSYRPVTWKAYIFLFLNTSSRTVVWKVMRCVSDQSFVCLRVSVPQTHCHGLCTIVSLLHASIRSGNAGKRSASHTRRRPPAEPSAAAAAPVVSPTWRVIHERSKTQRPRLL